MTALTPPPDELEIEQARAVLQLAAQGLTRRQKEAIANMLEGHDAVVLAEALGVSRQSTNECCRRGLRHMRLILEQLGIHSVHDLLTTPVIAAKPGKARYSHRA